MRDLNEINIEINGMKNHYAVGFINGKFEINYDEPEMLKTHNNLLRIRSAITIDKKDLDNIGITPKEFVSLINNPNANIEINTAYNTFGLMSEPLNQFVCVDVVDNDVICAREENHNLMEYMRRDIEDQVEFLSLKSYQEKLSNEHFAVFITYDNEPRVCAGKYTPPLNSSVFVNAEQPYITLDIHNTREYVNEYIDDYNYEQTSIEAKLSFNTEPSVLQNLILTYLQDTFGEDRYEDIKDNEILISSSPNMNFKSFDIKAILDKIHEIERTGEYKYNGLIGSEEISQYGYKDNKLFIGSQQDKFDNGVSINVEELIITESQVARLGITPDEFASSINNERGRITMIKLCQTDNEEVVNNSETYALSSFDTVKVMSDDLSTCLASEQNNYRMNIAYNELLDAEAVANQEEVSH